MSDRATRDTYLRAYQDFLERCKSTFTPFAPIELLDFFAGRQAEIDRLNEEIGAPGRQVAIIGERGVGKTSLAILAPFFTNRDDTRFHLVRCQSESTFDGIFAEILTDAGVSVVLNGLESARTGRVGLRTGPFDAGAGKDTRSHYKALAPPDKITPSFILKHFSDVEGLIVIDEYDRVRDEATHTRMAELLKHFSDARSQTKILLVGVAGTLRDLIGEHQSLTRCLAPIRLERMSRDELRDIIRRGEKKLKITFTGPVIRKMISLADGFPHYVHLIAHNAAKEAGRVFLDTEEPNIVVGEEHYHKGVRLAVENVEAQLSSDFNRAVVTVKRKSDKFRLVLQAMALATAAEVSISDIASFAGTLTARTHKKAEFSYHLGELVKADRAAILTKVREGCYKFTNPLMRPYIRLLLERDNILYHGGQWTFSFMKNE